MLAGAPTREFAAGIPPRMVDGFAALGKISALFSVYETGSTPHFLGGRDAHAGAILGGLCSLRAAQLEPFAPGSSLLELASAAGRCRSRRFDHRLGTEHSILARGRFDDVTVARTVTGASRSLLIRLFHQLDEELSLRISAWS
jgi:hypothetical protein